MTVAAELREQGTEGTTSPWSRPRTLLERAFFTKESVLKVMLNSRNECYFQWGWKEQSTWKWKKVKFNDMELGEILLVLEGKAEKASFFHTFEAGGESTTTQIWIHRSQEYCTFKVKECSKSLNKGEQKVLDVLLRHAILMINLNL